MKKRLLVTLLLIISLIFSACVGVEDNNTTDEPEIENQQTETVGEEEEKVPQENNEYEIVKMKISINGVAFTAELFENDTAKALVAMLPMTVNMSAMAHEKYYYLPNSLPTAAENPKTIQVGDIMLFGSNTLVLFYESFSTSYSYTKIGKIQNTQGLAAALGAGNVTVTFSKN